jgi:hypothetical protein
MSELLIQVVARVLAGLALTIIQDAWRRLVGFVREVQAFREWRRTVGRGAE